MSIFNAQPGDNNKNLVSRRRIIEQLPTPIQTDLLKKFFGVTVNQWFQPKAVEDISGYIGRRSGRYFQPESDYYVTETQKNRSDYQLEPAAVSADDQNDINFINFYQDLIGYLRFNGANVDNHSRLFEQDYYSWAPPINPDMLVNFSNYYWLVTGPTTHEIQAATNAVLDIIGKTQYTTGAPDNLTLQSGMRIRFANDANLDMNGKSFIVEGVGTQIKLIDDSFYDAFGLYDTQPYDTQPYDDARTNELTPQYVTINRSSQDRNPWSRTNRWFHRDLIGNIDTTDFSMVQARRPIIEFVPNIQLRNFGRWSRGDVDILIDNAGLLDIAGQPSWFQDGVELSDGFRVLFTNDPDPAKNNRIYRVFGINQLGEIGFLLDDLGLNDFGDPVVGENIRITRGDNNSNRELWFNGSTWVSGQQPINRYSVPLFDLYDVDSIRLDDSGMYPESSFQGSTIFGYQPQNTTTVDPYLGINLRFDDFGNIQFNNTLTSDVYDYQTGLTRTNIGGYKFYRVYNDADPDNDSYVNDWHPAETPSRQYVSYQWIMKSRITPQGLIEFDREYKLDFDPDANTPTALENYRVYLNGLLLKDNVDYNIVNDVLEISLSLELEDNDVLEARIYAQQINQVEIGHFEIPTNLSNNPNNSEITIRSFNEIYEHLISIIGNQNNIQGKPFGSNNYNSTARKLNRGEKILNHTASLLRTMAVSGNSDLDIMSAMRYAESEYSRFRRKFFRKIETFYTQGYTSQIPLSQWVADAIRDINLGKTTGFPFSNTGVTGDNYIPATPAFLGILPAWKPEKFLDTSRNTPTMVVRGHDGSLIDAYGNIIDDVILELENQIYNSISPKYINTTNPYDYLRTRPGYFRDTRYSWNEWNLILQPSFERWAVRERVDYIENTTYNLGNRFTWNYSTVPGPDGRLLPGFWRGIYLWVYDTDRPHTHPWEMLGISAKPTWWDQEYGSAPYTNNNLVMWNDIAEGRIRQGAFAGVYQHLARPGLLSIIPVDSQGNLLDPMAAGVATAAPSEFAAQQSWKFGDGSPGEYTWRVSDSYSFGLSEAMFLAHPARFVETFWDRNLLTISNNQWQFSPTEKRRGSNEFQVHNQILDDGNRFQSRGISQWITAYLENQGKNVNDNFASIIQDLDARLSYRVAGFIKPQNARFLTDNFGLLPNENIQTRLYQSTSIREATYSGVIVVWDGSVYRVFGYDNVSQNFATEPAQSTGPSTSITVDSVTITRFDKGTGSVEMVPYNTGFGTREQVYNFMVAYQRQLEKQGWVFDRYDSLGEPIDFNSSAKQFLQWSQNILNPGDALVLSPSADSIRFASEKGHVNNIESFVNGVYSVLDRDGFGLTDREFDISRLDDNFDVVMIDQSNKGIYLLKLSVSEFEHVCVIDNRTKFNDLIYDPVTAVRQERLRIFTKRTSQWTGKPEAFGFIIRDNDLIANFENTTDSMRDYFNVELADTYSTTINDLSKHLIGYQQRDYLGNLLLDQRTQFDYYRGMIREKGSIRSVTNILRNDFITKTADFDLQEEWAFLMGEYGNLTNQSTMQIQLLQSDFRNNPQIVEFTNNPVDDQEDNVISITTNDSRWILKRQGNNTINQFKHRNNGVYRRDLPTAGFVQVGETNYVLKNIDAVNAWYFDRVVDNQLPIADGETIWMTLTNGGSWDVMRICETNRILSVTPGVLPGDPSIITMENPHTLVADEWIIVDGSTATSPEFQGVQQVNSVTSPTVFTINTALNTPKTFVAGTGPKVLVLRSVRFANNTGRNAFNPPLGKLVGDRAFVSSNPNNLWEVSEWNGSSWQSIRIQNSRIDLDDIFNASIYNKNIQQTIIDLEIYDPAKGRISSAADREIYYKLDFDPAKYTNGDVDVYQIDPDLAWGAPQVGRLWWDLSTARFVDYEQGTELYRQQNWGALAPFTSVDIYQWTQSPVPPSSWDSYVSGFTADFVDRPTGSLPLGTDTPYVETTVYNKLKGTDEQVYFFWTLNPSTVPSGSTVKRKLSALDVQQLIANPRNQNVVWIAPIQTNAFLLNAVDELIDDKDSVLQINFYQNSEDSIVHKQWKLLRERDAVTPPDIRLWNKMRDSLVGFDDLNNTVPQPDLSSVIRYGNRIRPRQTWFVDRLQSRKEFVAHTNTMLFRTNVVDINPAWDNNLRFEEPQPDNTNYDIVVFNRTDRDNLQGTIAVGKRVLVEQDQLLTNHWSLWVYNGGTSWTLLDEQSYKMTNFWRTIDWYASGYDSTVRISQTFADVAQRNLGIFYEGEIVKILDNGSGRWAVFRYELQNAQPTFITIAQEDGTVEFLDNLWDYESANTYLDSEASVVFKKLLYALQTDLFNALEQNEIFFVMVHRVHDEQGVVPWMFKTSYVSGAGNADVLEQTYFQIENQSGNFVDYVQEVKPYHVKVRELTEDKQATDQMNVNMVDTNEMLIDLIYDRVNCSSNIPEGADPRDYNIQDLTAADRVQLLYSPTEGMPEKVLKQLISRCEYGGTILDGKTFYQFGTLLGVGYDNSEMDYFHGYDFDENDLENFYDVFVNGGDPLNAAQNFGGGPNGLSSIIIDGNKFVQPHLADHHPEELVKVRSGDAVVIDVYNESPGGEVGLGYDNESYDSQKYDFDASDVVVPFGAFPTVRVKRYVGRTPAISGPFSIGQQPQNKQSVFVYQNSTLLKEGTGYTVDWNTNQVSLVNPLGTTDELKILSFGIGGSKVRKRKTFKNTSATSFDLNEVFGNDNQVLVTVDGEIASFTSSGTVINITSPLPSNSTVFVAIFDNNLYSVVRTQEFTAATAGPETYTLSHAPAKTVPTYNTVIVHRNGLRLSPPLMKLYQQDNVTQFFKIGAAASSLSEIIVYRDTQLLVNGTDYNAFFITGFTINNPGSNYQVGDSINVVGSGSGCVAQVSSIGLGGEILSITVSDPGNGYVGPTTATVISGPGVGAVITPQVVNDEVNMIGAPIIDSMIQVILLQGMDYTINDPDQVTVNVTAPGDSIKITTFSEDLSFAMRTEVFNGNAQTFYALGDNPYDTNSAWITVNGQRQIHHHDYKFDTTDGSYDDEYQGYDVLYDSDDRFGVRFPRNNHTSGDRVVITYFTGVPYQQPIAWRLYKNIFGKWQHLRISDENSTVLTAPLTSNQTTVVVQDATVLAVPDINKQEPGVIFINGERITYWEIDTTNVGLHELRRCMRGTQGTGINPDLSTGAVVRDGSKNQHILGGYQWQYSPEGMNNLKTDLVRFLLERPGTFNYP